MNAVSSPVTGKPYGSGRRSAGSGAPPAPARLSPLDVTSHDTATAARTGRRAVPDAALTEAIRAVLAASPFQDEGSSQDLGPVTLHGYTDLVAPGGLRLMREHDLLAPGRVG